MHFKYQIETAPLLQLFHPTPFLFAPNFLNRLFIKVPLKLQQDWKPKLHYTNEQNKQVKAFFLSSGTRYILNLRASCLN